MKTLNDTTADSLIRAKGGRRPAPLPPRLHWRSPWPVWQGLSWVVVTMSAPPFWIIGALLMINSHSDCPLFWPSVMGVVAATNAISILYTNQCHHRQPFSRLTQPMLRYFGMAMGTGCVLFALLASVTDVFQDLSAPLISTVGDSLPMSVWAAAVTAAFGLLSFAHASVVYVWLAFSGPRRY